MFATFEEYIRSLDFLVMTDESEMKRLDAARRAGRAPNRDTNVSDRPYLYERLRDAFYGDR